MTFRGHLGVIGKLLACMFIAIAIAACNDDGSDPSAAGEAATLPPGTFVPLVNAYSPLSEQIQYVTAESREYLYSAAAVLVQDASAAYGALVFQIACTGDEIEISFYNVLETASPGKVEVEVRFDGGERQTWAWQGASVLGLDLLGDAAEDFFAEMSDAETMSVTIPDVQVGPTDIPIADLLQTPIRGNLEYCGDYHETERQVLDFDYEPVVGLSGTAGPHITYQATESSFGSRSVLTTVLQVAPEDVDPSLSELRLSITCANSRYTTVRLEGLPPSARGIPAVAVTILLDDAEPVTESWWIKTDADRITADTETSSLWRGLAFAESMTLTIPRLEIGPLRFDLRGLFETPVQGNLDHCGWYADT